MPASRPHVSAAALRWCAAAPHILKAHLREGVDALAEVSHILTPEEVRAWRVEWAWQWLSQADGRWPMADPAQEEARGEG